mgnify:FL=1
MALRLSIAVSLQVELIGETLLLSITIISIFLDILQLLSITYNVRNQWLWRMMCVVIT